MRKYQYSQTKYFQCLIKYAKSTITNRYIKVDNQSSSSITLVPKPLSSSLGISTTVTREYNSSLASSSSFLLRAMQTLILLGTLRIPWLQTYLFSFTSTLTSFVPIAFCANFLISLIALGAFFLNVLFIQY